MQDSVKAGLHGLEYGLEYGFNSRFVFKLQARAGQGDSAAALDAFSGASRACFFIPLFVSFLYGSPLPSSPRALSLDAKISSPPCPHLPCGEGQS